MRCNFCSPAGTKVNTPLGERNIETLRSGETVIGHDGNCPKINIITDTYERDYSGDLICINLDNEKTLKLTPDHEVFTKRGWKTASDLREDDELIEF
jgi:intein/homing endonuclease